MTENLVKEQSKNIVELDTIMFKIPYMECELCNKDIPIRSDIGGLSYQLRDEDILFKASSKLMATPRDIGGIRLDNIKTIPQIIYDRWGIYMDTEYFYSCAEIYRIDPKLDIGYFENPSATLNAVRVYLKKNTNKYTIVRYGDLIYEHGFTVIPKTLTGIRFCSYNKGIELGKSRNKEFIEIFDRDYFCSLKKVIRCEMELTKRRLMRKVFGIPQKVDVTFEQIFMCTENVVRREYLKLLGEIEEII